MVQLWEAVGVYSVSVCVFEAALIVRLSLFVSFFQAGILRACSSIQPEFGFVCVDMFSNLCVCVCVCILERGHKCGVNVVSELWLFSDSTQSN